MKLLRRLVSRYGIERCVYRVDRDTLIVEGKARYMRWGGTPSQTTMVDWDGGPCIVVGDVAGLTLDIRTKRTIESIEPLAPNHSQASEGVVRVRVRLGGKA